MGVSDIESAVASVGNNRDIVPAVNEKIRKSITGKITAFHFNTGDVICTFGPAELSVHGCGKHKTA